jgi:hypothetical protein
MLSRCIAGLFKMEWMKSMQAQLSDRPMEESNTYGKQYAGD